MCCRDRADIQLAVEFLTMSLNNHDLYDYKNPSRLIRYLLTAKDLPLTFEAENTNLIKWWVGASFAIHNDTNIHSGNIMLLGKSTMYSEYSKQKINTGS